MPPPEFDKHLRNHDRRPPPNGFHRVTPFMVFFSIILMSFFYLNYYLLIPKYFAKNKGVLYFTFIAILFLFAISSSSIQQLPFQNKDFNLHFISFHSFGAFVLMVSIWGASSALRFGNDWIVSEKQKQELELINTKTELSFLKAQINPHFLFNTLNDIYALALKKSDATPSVVISLANMMRYVLDESQNNFVPLEKEIEYINEYIELQRISHTKNVIIDYTIIGSMLNKEIAPLILLPIIENAFKFGSTTQSEVTIKININITETSIIQSVENEIADTGTRLIESTGVGLTNLQRRLTLLYHEKHKLDFGTLNNKFNAKLILNF
jgi:hypothetical protein